MRNNIVTTTKRAATKMSIIILAAGEGKRMKSYGVRSLISVGGMSIIDRQLTLIGDAYPSVEIVVVAGFEANKLRSSLPSTVRVVENENYTITGAVRSLHLAFGVTQGNIIGIIHGDLVFNKYALPPVIKESMIIVDKQNGLMKTDEIGCILSHHEEVEKFDAIHNLKWGQIAFLMGRELELCKKFAANPDKFNHPSYQVLDNIVCGPRGVHQGKLKAISDPKIKITDVDMVKDLEIAKTI